MNSYELVGMALLRVADSLTTTRLGLADGRIEISDALDIFKNAKVVMQKLELISSGIVAINDGSMWDLKSATDNIVMG